MAFRSVSEPTFGTGNYTRFLATPSAVRSLETTIRVSLIVTLACIVIGYCYAYTLVGASPRLRAVLLVAVLLPAAVSLLVRTFAIEALIRDTGIINLALLKSGIIHDPLPLIRTPLGVSIGMLSMLLPYMVLPLYAVMVRIDPEYVIAASSLGASPRRAFMWIFLPMSLPGVLAGGLIVFVSALGYYVVPSILGSGNDLFLSELVNYYIGRAEWGYGSAIGMVLLLLMLVTLLTASRIVKVSDVFGSMVAGDS
jgi:putative spermidine/putrescine transport system permease protein